jgi:hypothetical protein
MRSFNGLDGSGGGIKSSEKNPAFSDIYVFLTPSIPTRIPTPSSDTRERYRMVGLCVAPGIAVSPQRG